MIAHVSPASQHYTDTLATVQLASRIHRMRRRKIKVGYKNIDRLHIVEYNEFVSIVEEHYFTIKDSLCIINNSLTIVNSKILLLSR